MNEEHFLSSVLLILSAAVIIVATFKKLKLSPVLGYFVAGGIIGEHGLKYVSSKNTELLGEIGVIFLLFAIGLELTFERLKAMRRYVFGFGSLQVILTSLALSTAAYLMGESVYASIILGGGLAMSSTAIVLQVIAESRQQSTQIGRVSLSVLLMQDFAVVPLIVLAKVFSNKNLDLVGALTESTVKAVITIIFIFVVGRIFLRPVFHTISSSNTAESNEIFIATTILIALGTAWLTDYMDLSMALGAFAAGLLVAETEFQLQAEESIAPFKALFLGLFFMSVGMSINLELVMKELPLIAIISASLILIKSLIIFMLALLFQFKPGNAIHLGLILSQGSEFAFILFRLADKDNFFKIPIPILLLVVTVTMAFTPMIAAIGNWLAKKIDKKEKQDFKYLYKDASDLNNHVIIIGFGRVGQMVARILQAENVNFIALDVDSEHVSSERDKGFPVYLGDGSSIEVLEYIATPRASSVIVAMSNEITLKKCSRVISTNFPNLPIIARATDLSKAREFYAVGVKTIVPETYETGLQLGGAVLKVIGISEFEVSRIKNLFRAGNYVRLPKDISDSIK